MHFAVTQTYEQRSIGVYRGRIGICTSHDSKARFLLHDASKRSWVTCKSGCHELVSRGGRHPLYGLTRFKWANQTSIFGGTQGRDGWIQGIHQLH